jgi:nicotinate-nucleotide pyrophosphorylase (carboxylating)
MSYEHLLSPSWETKIIEWLKEDIPSFDYGGYVMGETEERAILWGKSDGVLSGVPFFNAIFAHLDCQVDWLIQEGQEFPKYTQIAIVKGKVRNILLGERVALNLIARSSGISTL